MNTDRPYVGPGGLSEQAEPSTANPISQNLQMRILIELQLHSMILANAYEITDNLNTLRQNVADSIT